jgi:uncharacterized SAM-dependent methyltransferase
MVILKKKQQEQQINDLIFKELIKRGYSLEGNTRVWNIADSKLWYLTPDQSQAYLDLEDTAGFKENAFNIEHDLINQNIGDILEKIGHGSINIIDLGCGDGKKAADIAHQLKKLDPKVRLRYCPIDISGYMVEKAIETFSHLDVEEIIEFKYNISDFENLENVTPLLTKENFNKNLFLLLGYTLGNFEVNELLYEIRTAMKKEDALVIVSGIGNEKWGEWAEERKKDKMSDNFFGKIPLQLGLKKDEIEFGARFQNNRVEYYYSIKKDKKIEFQGKEVFFNKGDQIVVAVSYKHDKEDLLHILNMHFDDVMFKVSEDRATFLALCKK